MARLTPAILQILPGLGYRQVSSHWLIARDGDVVVWEMYQQHYSRRHYRKPRQRLFMGPGEKLVLLHVSGRAAFGWRKFISGNGQDGVNNSLFINHGAGLSSELILEAEQIAWQRWPGERLYTYVNPRRIQSSNPGYCYQMAGWRKCGITQSGLVVLQKRGNCDPRQET